MNSLESVSLYLENTLKTTKQAVSDGRSIGQASLALSFLLLVSLLLVCWLGLAGLFWIIYETMAETREYIRRHKQYWYSVFKLFKDRIKNQ